MRDRALGIAGVLLAAALLWLVRGGALRIRPQAMPGPALEAADAAIAPPQGASVPGQERPALPRVTLDTTVVSPSGRVIAVPASGNLQAALNAAQPGDVIELPAGATFVGNFILPYKTGATWITVRSSLYPRLPPPGSRVSPGDAVSMPKLVSPNSAPALSTALRAHHYRLIGIEITTTSSVNFNLVLLEAPRQTSIDAVPTDIIVDRCYIHGTLEGEIRRGVALNAARLAVIDSYLSDFHQRGADTQAIAGWNGPGPFKIVNNYLEAAGENVIFGGADPSIPDLVPSDIEIRRNDFFKPLSWKIGEPEYAGRPWRVKNLFELKNARRVLVEGNIFEHNWAHAQNGFAILFTVRNQDGRSPWSVVEDVTYVSNIVRDTGSGINILGRDDIHPSQQTQRILIKNNLFEDVNGHRWGGEGRLFQLLNGTVDVIIEQNMGLQTGEILAAGPGPHARFIFRNNIVLHNTYGIGGDNTYGNPGLTLSTYFPGAVFEGNILVGGNPGRYPPRNFFAASLYAIGFVNLHQGDCRLSGTSAYKHAGTERRDPGVDLGALRMALGPMARIGCSGDAP
jgi:hypothetical protein